MNKILKIVVYFFLLPLVILNCTEPNPSLKYRPLIEKYVDYWNTGNFEGIETVLHPDFELRSTPKYEAGKGIEAFKESIIKSRKSYPDFHIELHEIIYDTDAAAARWTITATNTSILKHPPNGKHIEVMGMSIVHFVDNKIKDEWIASNNLEWLKQLGYKLIPPSEDK